MRELTGADAVEDRVVPAGYLLFIRASGRGGWLTGNLCVPWRSPWMKFLNCSTTQTGLIHTFPLHIFLREA